MDYINDQGDTFLGNKNKELQPLFCISVWFKLMINNVGGEAATKGGSDDVRVGGLVAYSVGHYSLSLSSMSFVKPIACVMVWGRNW